MISENYRIVPTHNPKDWTAGGDGTVINCSNVHKVTFVFVTGSMAAVQQVLLKCGATTTVDTDVYTVGDAIHVKRNNANDAAANCDLLSNSVALEASQKYYQLLSTNQRMYVHEFDCSKLPAGKPYLAATLPAATSANFLCGIAILHMRYKSDNSANAVVE